MKSELKTEPRYHGVYVVSAGSEADYVDVVWLLIDELLTLDGTA